MTSRSIFVELDRRFTKQQMGAAAEEDADGSYLDAYLFSGRGTLSWKKMLERHRSVILGEAGSGKTWEMKEQASRLEAEGEAAFFVRLDELASASCQVAMTPEPFNRFQLALERGRTIFLFLDSVDEAKLVSPAAFRVALKNLREALPLKSLAQIKLFLSTRISAWDSHTEIPYLKTVFGVGPKIERASVSNAEDDSENTNKSNSSEWEVFKIQPLDRDRVGRLAHASGITSPDQFLDAIEEAHAWEFARRPADVKPLVHYWLKTSRLGTLTQLIEFDVEMRLKESRTHTSGELSDDESRQGTETLAAACVLCQNSVIRLPSAENLEGVLEGKACLPADGWTDVKYQALLDRPIFDEANLGKVRFHHRRVREYLAARWIERLMAAGCSLQDFEDIFFDQVGGVRVMRGSLASVAAWLCAGNQFWNLAMQDWVCATNPEIVLRYGDPSALPTRFRRQLLQNLAVQAKTASHLWLTTDDGTLSRFGGSDLGADLTAIVVDKSLAEDLRLAALKIIKFSKLGKCLTEVMSVFADTESDTRIKLYAGSALIEIGSPDTLGAMAGHFLQMREIPLHLVELAIQHLWPAALTTANIVELLKRAKRDPERADHVDWKIGRSLDEKLNFENARELSTHLMVLIQEEPCFLAEYDRPPISQLHGWLSPLLRTTSSKILEADVVSSSDAQLVADCVYLLGGIRTGEKSPDPLDKLSLRHPEVRRAYLWRQVALQRSQGGRIVEGWWDLSLGHGYRFNPVEDDISWLAQDAVNRTEMHDRVLATQLACGILGLCACSRRSRLSVKRAAQADDKLRAVYKKWVMNRKLRSLRRFRYKAEETVMRKYWWQRRWRSITKLKNWAKNHWYLFRNRRQLARGELVHCLANLSRDAENPGRSKWAVDAWDQFERKWGKRTRQAVRGGCKKFWRSYTPLLPHAKAERNSTPNQVIVGLTGILAEWRDGELDWRNLSQAEAMLLTRYACEEMNGFPVWFQDLANARPAAVGDVLAEGIRGEWSNLDAVRHEGYVLGKLGQLECQNLDAVRGALSDLLSASSAVSEHLVTLGISALMNCGRAAEDTLVTLGTQYIQDTTLAAGIRARWLKTLLLLRADQARALFECVSQHADADDVITAVIASVGGRFENASTGRSESYLTTAVLEWLLPIVYRHVRPAEDIHRTGGYTPTYRDDAQQMRGALVKTLAQQAEPTVPAVLANLALTPELAVHADWFRHLRLEALTRIADRNPWSEENIRQFSADNKRTPGTASDLFRITRNRLLDIKKQVEVSNSALRRTLVAGVRENALRGWLADQLTIASRGQFTAPQESVILNEQRPDIRIQHPAAGTVSIEIKWAQDWSFNELMAALEVQLVTDYLRAHDANHGILVLGMHLGGNASWRSPAGLVELPALVEILEARAKEIEAANMQVKRVSVISIDFR